tara:strand:- start:3492 stop:4100 length:609 start_codon:yes stop_codon:yes gene_type:complete
MLNKLGWPKESLVLISLAIGYLITGGLHLDGLMDTADGIAAGKQKCLEAMKDSRVGAIGIQSLILIIALQISALIKLGYLTPFILPISNFWGRIAPLWAIEYFPYLHKKEKTNLHISHWENYFIELIPSIIFIILFLFFLNFSNIRISQPISTSLFIFSGILPAIFIPQILGDFLGGHSGDSYGASVVLVETIILLLAAIIF